MNKFFVFFLLTTAFIFGLSSFTFADQNNSKNNTQNPTVNATYAIGDIIPSPTENYTVIDELGEGMFGKVLAVENSKGQKYAMKTYKTHSDPQLLQHAFTNAEREFVRGQILDCPNIIKSFEFFSHAMTDGQISKNLILQFVDGKPLFLTKRRVIDQEKAFDAAIHFCDAISYAKSLHFIHLDLHEGNVMLTNLGDAMIIDLASFFSLDELIAYVETHITNTDEDSTNEPKEAPGAEQHPQHSPTPQIQAQKYQKTAMKIAAPTAIEHKIEQFFKQHPDLFAKMQEAVRQYKEMRDRPMVMAQMGSSKKQKEETVKENNVSNHPDLTSVYAFYFDAISNICISIIEKSDIDRTDKINLRVEIKKLVWNYREDVEEGKVVPLEFYFDQLVQILKTRAF